MEEFLKCDIMLLCKQKALYVKCCIIANGVTDSQGDTLNAEDIKKIFTSFNNQDNFEIYHEELPLKEVSLLENYISTADEAIGTAIVPSGSWNAVVRVDNPEIKEGLLTGEFGGVSLNNRIAPRCKGNLTGTVRYQDVADAECVIPLLISFVERGANGYGLHVMDYDAYIKKSKDTQVEENGGHIMDFEKLLNGLKSLIKEAEDTPEEEPAIEKEDDETKEEEAEVEETTEETEVVEDEAEEEPTVEKEDTTVEEEKEAPAEEEEEPTIEKEEDREATETEEEAETTTDNDLEARVAKLEEIIAELTKVEETEESEEEEEALEDEAEDEDTPKITKSEKVIIENKPAPQTNYYEMTGRDPRTGKKIRK